MSALDETRAQIEEIAHVGDPRYRSQPAVRDDVPSGHRVLLAPVTGFDGGRPLAVAVVPKRHPRNGVPFLFRLPNESVEYPKYYGYNY